MRKKKNKDNIQAIRDIVNEAINTGHEEFLVDIIYKLQEEYYEIATLSTMGEYQKTWTHKQTLDYITKEI